MVKLLNLIAKIGSISQDYREQKEYKSLGYVKGSEIMVGHGNIWGEAKKKTPTKKLLKTFVFVVADQVTVGRYFPGH